MDANCVGIDQLTENSIQVKMAHQLINLLASKRGKYSFLRNYYEILGRGPRAFQGEVNPLIGKLLNKLQNCYYIIPVTFIAWKLNGLNYILSSLSCI